MPGLPETQRQENFSLAYVRAIAAACGFSVSSLDDDYDSVDALISATGIVEWNGRISTGRSPCLAVQVKCTHATKPKNGVLKFELPVKNYNDLRDTGRLMNAIVVVLCTPKLWSQRLRWSDKSLILRQVAYWKSLRGEPATTNGDSITIAMTELFSPDSLSQLMFTSAQGEWL